MPERKNKAAALIQFTNCKINLGLRITERRPDGYHNLETIFFPLPLYDVLELTPADRTHLTIWGQSIPGAIHDNIILKAYRLLQADFPELPPLHFHLLKNIPVGAGLGAGSANGAYTLLALNEGFALGLDQKQLAVYALQLGSDCPFFIYNQPCLATARGECLTPMAMDLNGYRLVLVNPKIHISTPWAFSRIQPGAGSIPFTSLRLTAPETWKSILTNDFEAPVFAAHPPIAAIKESLYEMGAVFSLMSGSGSTVYGLFERDRPLAPDFPADYFVKIIDL
ncbi:4-(cytidine 5'-diphospho)-2-C-methyl-D-erythritol kinase [Niabella terrae]